MSPDTRKHRGPHPSDQRLFSPEWVDVLCRAAVDYCHLLSREYPPDASLKLVGDRYGLRARQRMALRRISCSDAALNTRESKRVTELEGEAISIDGFNTLITVESALAGGIVFVARDGSLRDLASIHGTYRSVQETEPGIALVAQELAGMHPASVEWLLDKPVSNSGRLAALIRAYSERHRLGWTVSVPFNPDKILSESSHIVITADSSILDRSRKWFNLTARIVRNHIPDCWSISVFKDLDE